MEKIIPRGPEAAVKTTEQAIGEIMAVVSGLEIVNDECRDTATVLLGRVKDVAKNAEAERKKIVDPMNKAVKAVNNLFKPGIDRLEELEKIIKGKIAEYIRKQQEAARREQERIERENEKKMAAYEKKIEAGKSAAIPVMAAPTIQAQTKFSAGDTKIHTVKIRRFAIENLDDVPREYMRLDEEKVGKLVRAGIEKIPGLKIWTEETIAAR